MYLSFKKLEREISCSVLLIRESLAHFWLDMGAHSFSCLSLSSLSSIREILIPLLGRSEMTGFFPSPITKTLAILVAKWLLWASLMWTMSKEPGCFSTCWMIPTLPILLPPVMMTEALFSNLIKLSTSELSRLSYKRYGYI